MDKSTPSFVAVWTESQPEVRRYIFMLVPKAADAEEVLQETAVRLWEKFDEYDPEQPFTPWAIRFAYTEVMKWRQRATRDRLVFSDALVAQLDETVGEEAPMLEARRRALTGCLKLLNRKERQLLLARYSKHGGVKEQAQTLEVSIHKLYYQVSKLRTRLLACISSKLQDAGWQDV